MSITTPTGVDLETPDAVDAVDAARIIVELYNSVT
jgi:hypothetical protein